MWRHHNMCWKWQTICVQTGLNPARRILEIPCQYVRCHCLNFFGDVCFQGVYGSWFVLVNSPFQISPQSVGALSQMTEKSAERRVRQETGWLVGGPLFRVATIRLTTHTIDTFLFISHTTNLLLFKFRWYIFIGVRITKEMPGSVASGTRCIFTQNTWCTGKWNTHSKINVFRKCDGFGGKCLKNGRKTEAVCWVQMTQLFEI